MGPEELAMTTSNPAIAALFQLGQPAGDITRLTYPLIASPKLNGIRAIWFPPGHKLAPTGGFYSRGGVMYECLAHIRPQLSNSTGFPIDGELYCHGMSLQDIAAAVTPNKQVADADTMRVGFYAFDALIRFMPARQRKLWLSDNMFLTIKSGPLDYLLVNSPAELTSYYEHITGAGYEGLMLQSPHAHYTSGRSRNILKMKAWKFARVRFDSHKPGEGKYAGEGVLGAMYCSFNGLTIKVGTGFDDAFRFGEWRGYIGRTAIIQYLELTADGLPFNPSLVGWEE